jgi:hypothetical protein
LLLDLASTATLGFTFPDFEVPWNGTSSSNRGRLWLLPVTPPLLCWHEGALTHAYAWPIALLNNKSLESRRIVSCVIETERLSIIWKISILDLALRFGGGLDYLHRRPASCKRRRKGNSVPGGITEPPCSLPSRLGECQMRQWSMVTGSAWLGLFFYHPILFTICTSTFSKLVEGCRWVAWRGALISVLL